MKKWREFFLIRDTLFSPLNFSQDDVTCLNRGFKVSNKWGCEC